MCGIVMGLGTGIEWVQRAVQLLRRRGPDAQEVRAVGRGVVLGHARLSIVDVDARSNQPFASSCQRYVMVYNGEMYNCGQLRRELEAMGSVFRTTSDTEVVLQSLVTWGHDALGFFDGMFALIFVDLVAGTALIARDPLGEKPLFFATGREDGTSTFAAASDAGPLAALPGVDRQQDTEAMADYLRWLYVPAPRTMWRGIRQLSPGHKMVVELESGSVSDPVAYYSLEQKAAKARDAMGSIAIDEARDGFQEVFTRCVASRMMSDVGIGMFLSGGIDSNSIASVVARTAAGRSARAYVMDYGAGAGEAPLARAAARHYGVELQVHTLSEMSGSHGMDAVLNAFDQPFGNATALSVLQLSSVASAHQKVCLVGDGGDEAMAGYPRHRAAVWRQNVPSSLGMMAKGVAATMELGAWFGVRSRAWWRLHGFLQACGLSPADAYLDWSTFLDESQVAALLREADGTTQFSHQIRLLYERNAEDPLRASALVDYTGFVPYNLMQCADRAGMANGLELRSPFLATELVEFSLAIPSIAKRVGGGVKPLITRGSRVSLPDCIKRQPKRPFNPPMQAIVDDRWRQFDADVRKGASVLGNWLDESALRRAWLGEGGRGNPGMMLRWGLLNLNEWLRRWR